jgi:hypothetical protein
MEQDKKGAKAPSVSSTGAPPLTPVRAAAKQGQSGGPGGVQPPATPNGFRIFAYAKDPDALTQYINQLRANPRFQQDVHFSEANVERVYVTAMNEAMVPARGGGSQAVSASTSQSKFAEVAPLSGQAWDTVVFFRVDVQFAPPPAGGGGGAPGAGGPPTMPAAPVPRTAVAAAEPAGGANVAAPPVAPKLSAKSKDVDAL